MTAFQERLGRFAVQSMTGLNTVVFRLSAGRVGGNVPSGAPICLLTTTGRRTGRRRTVPLLFIRHGGALVVVASRGGMSTHPAWSLNVLADARVTVEVPGELARPAVARLASDDERAMLWPVLVSVYERFETYRSRTERPIPVVIIEPR